MTEQRRIARDQPAPGPGIVHLGLGAFFRSHGALVIEDAIRAGGGDWGITGASLRSADVRDRLAGQDFVYTAVEMAPEGERRRVVNVLCDVLFAPDAPDALIGRMADPSTRIVSADSDRKRLLPYPKHG